MRRAFTLIELLVIVGIICAMAGVGIVNVRAGQGAARIKGAARDIFAAIRQARSLALVSQQPVVLTYSITDSNGEPCAKIDLESVKLFREGVDREKIRTVKGDRLPSREEDLVRIEKAVDATKLQKRTASAKETRLSAESQEGSGTLIDDVLFAPIDEDVVRGIRIKVLKEDNLLNAERNVPRRSKVSVFSNVDYILGKYATREKTAAADTAKTADGASEGKVDSKEENQTPVRVVWETNGRVEPHRVWVYADGQRPEQGLQIRIDRFGAARILNGDGSDEE